MKAEYLKHLFEQIKWEFSLHDFVNGDCLNLAVAVHNYLKEQDIKSYVIPVMRNASASDFTPLFDHAILLVELENYAFSDGLNSKYTFDINGNDAYERWITTSPFYKDPSIKFWLNKPPSDLEEFCSASQEKYGDEPMRKMLNNRILRNNIQNYLNSLK